MNTPQLQVVGATTSGSEIAEAIDVLRRRSRLGLPVDAYITAGMARATAYRRIDNPGELKWDEIAQISRYYGVPVSVLAEGEFATMKWLHEQEANGTPPDGGGSVIQRYREQGHGNSGRTTRAFGLIEGEAQAA